MRPRRPILVLAAAAVLLPSSGCGGSSSGPKDVATPTGLGVSVLQYRSDYTVRRMQIKVTNAGSGPVTVTAARLNSTAFDGDAIWQSRDRADETLIAPGTSTDLPAALPPSTCSSGIRTSGVRTSGVQNSGDENSSAQNSGIQDSGFENSARLELRLADGSTGRTAALPVRDPFGSITQVHTDDCRRAAALRIADLSLVDPLRTTTRGGHLVGLLDLRLTPSGKPGTLVLESIGSTTLLSPPTGAVWPIDRTVRAGTGAQTVTLELQAARCDPHAIAEDKLGTVLPVTLRVDGGSSGIVAVPADPQVRKQIQRFVHEACTAG